MSDFYACWVEVDLDVFENNLRIIRDSVGEGTRVMLVVKADAYGHGAACMAQAAERFVSMLGVATLHEGIELRGAGITLPIVILTPTLQDEVEEILEHGLAPSVATREYAMELSATAVRRRVTAGFQVEVDTGMGRGGVSEREAEEFVREVAALPALSLEGLYTHFPESDAPDLDFSRDQVVRFLALAGRLRASGVRVPLVHAANSAGAVRMPEARLEMIRPGILAYGLMPRPGLDPFQGIHPVMSMKARLVQVRDLEPGATVSYDRTFTVKRPSRIGVVPVGYGHGLSWLLSNQGSVLVHGRRAPIAGNVTMDITMVDLTDIPGAQTGDEVVIFGHQRGETLGAQELATRSRTLVYEVLCTLGKRVVREYRRGETVEQVMTLVGERHVVTGPGTGEHVKYSRMPARAASPGKRLPRVGDQVRHDALGVGLVLRVSGEGEHSLVLISFDGDATQRKFKAEDPRIHVLGGS